MNFSDQRETSKHNVSRGLKSVSVHYHVNELMADERHTGIITADIKPTVGHMRETLFP